MPADAHAWRDPCSPLVGAPRGPPQNYANRPSSAEASHVRRTGTYGGQRRPSQVNGVFRVNVEGVLVVSGTPTSATRWIEGTAVVTVTDGRLTVSNGTGAGDNKVNYLDIDRPG